MYINGINIKKVTNVNISNNHVFVWLDDKNGNSFSLKMDNVQDWLNFIVDLEEKIRYAYAEQFELLYDEY